MNIAINYPSGIYYGVWDNAGVWTQADSDNMPTAIAVLDSLPTVAGLYEGTVYEDGEVIAPDNTAEFELEYFAFLDGITEGVLSTVSDATLELALEILGSTTIQMNHARGLERRLPDGSAWHGEVTRALLRGLSTEFRCKELQIADTASINNMLFGDNLTAWQKVLKLEASGTIEDQELAVKRKLSDVGGLRAEDLTRELHAAGFTTLYAYANKFRIDMTALTAGSWTTSGTWTTARGKKKYASIDPRVYENYLPGTTAGAWTTSGTWTFANGGLNEPLTTAGSWTTSGIWTTASNEKAGGHLVANSSENEEDLWSGISGDSGTWKNYIFICGDEFLKTVRIDLEREKELRKLVLEIKPFKTYAIMSIYFNL